MTTDSPTTRPQPARRLDSRSGAALFFVMILLAVLTLYGATAYLTSSLDIRTARSHILNTRALFQADAGVRHVSTRIIEDVRSGALTLDSAVQPVNYSAPSSLSFDPVTSMTRLADQTSYSFDVTGWSGEARVTVQAVVAIDEKLRYGLFADRSMSFGPTARVYSYDSSVLTHPAPADSTSEATVAVNGSMGGNSSTVDGTIYLGESSTGTPASYSHEFSSTQSATIQRVDHIDPDPLGVVGGALEAEFARVATVNDNASAVGGSISGGKLRISGNVTLRAGDYYVSEVNLGNGQTLRVDATLGPVNLYLTGSAYIAPNAAVDTGPPVPNNLRIYSNSTQTLDFAPNLHFVGFIYAPLARIDVKPNASIYGGLWGRDLNIMPNGDVFVDSALFRQMFSRSLMLYSWKQVLE